MTENNTPEGYKETEIGCMPVEWQLAKLGEITTYSLGRTPPRKEKQYWDNGIVPWVSIADMRENSVVNITKEKISQKAFDEIFSRKISKRGTLLMSFKLTIGRTAFLGIDATHNEAIISIHPSDNIRKDFLFHYLPTVDYTKYMDKAIKGNTLNKSKINKILVPLPPLPEQERIAYVLSSVQEAIECTEVVIQASRQLKQSMMKHLFTYGTVPPSEAEKVKLKDTEIGQIPEEWEVIKLGDVAKISSGGTPSRDNPEYWGGNIPWVKTGEIDYNIITDTEEKITKEGLENSSTRWIPTGTLLMAMYGQGITRGKVAILGIEAAVNQACAAILTKDKIDSHFLFYYFTLNYEKIRTLGHGANQKNLNAILIKSIKVPLPPLQEQKRITNMLSPVDIKIELENNKKMALDSLFNTLLSNLMTAKVRVNNLQMKHET